MGWLARLRQGNVALRQRLEPEGLVRYAERAKGSLTYRNYRAPGKRFTLTKMRAYWTVAVTDARLLVMWGQRTYLDASWFNPAQASAVHASVTDKGALLITFDDSAFHDDRSGTVEIRATLEDAAGFVEVITARQHRP